MKYTIIILCSLLFFSGCSMVRFQNNHEDVITANKSITENEEGNTSQSSIIDISNQKLDKIPDYVFRNTNIEVLDASSNNLTGSIPAEIRYLENLRVLDLSKNNMTGLPAEIGQLKSLEVLNVSDNKLTGLPYELGNLSNLKEFNISGNQYSEQDLAIILENLPDTVIVLK